jgi:hypothetical protein
MSARIENFPSRYKFLTCLPPRYRQPDASVTDLKVTMNLELGEWAGTGNLWQESEELFARN